MQRGFTLIESLFAVTILLALALGVFEAYRALYLSMAVSEEKLSALYLINERFEEVMSLPYDSASSTEAVYQRNGRNFEISTTVLPLTSPADHKLVEVRVSCGDCRNFDPVAITGRIASDEQ